MRKSTQARNQGASRDLARIIVHAAAEKTKILATMTGDALMSTPYITQSSAPAI
jgi:hypothetical protein